MILALALMATGTAQTLDRMPANPTPRDLAFLHDYARCEVKRSPVAAERVLARDYRTGAYREGLRDYAEREDSSCLVGGRLRFQGVLLAGAMAEALIDRAGVAADPARLAWREGMAPVVARDEGEALALCTVQTRPDEVRSLLATKPASAEESAGFKPLVPVVATCTAAGANARFNKPGLRAILALAYRRLMLRGAGGA